MDVDIAWTHPSLHCRAIGAGVLSADPHLEPRPTAESVNAIHPARRAPLPGGALVTKCGMGLFVGAAGRGDRGPDFGRKQPPHLAARVGSGLRTEFRPDGHAHQYGHRHHRWRVVARLLEPVTRSRALPPGTSVRAGR